MLFKTITDTYVQDQRRVSQAYIGCFEYFGSLLCQIEGSNKQSVAVALKEMEEQGV